MEAGRRGPAQDTGILFGQASLMVCCLAPSPRRSEGKQGMVAVVILLSLAQWASDERVGVESGW